MDRDKVFVYGFIILVTCIIPLITFNKYFDLTLSKGKTFIVGSIGLIIYQLLFNGRKTIPLKNLCRTEKLCIIFCIICCIATFNAKPISRALWGDSGTYMGTYTYIVGLICLLYLVNSNINISLHMKRFVCVMNSIIFMVPLLNVMGIDLFSLHEGIVNYQHFDYLGTLGNVNWIAGYLTMIFLYYLYCYLCEDANNSKSYLILLIICSWNIHLIHSDAIYLSLAVATIFLTPLIFKSTLNVFKIAVIAIIYCLFGLLLNLPLFNSFIYSVKGISRFMLNPFVIFILITLILFLVLTTFITKNQTKNVWNVMICVSIFICFACVIVSLLIHLKMYNYSWGNNRLNTWIHSMRIFKYYYTDMNRLIGVGPDMLFYVYKEVSDVYGANLVNAHNCFIQVMMTFGVIGLSVFTVLIGTILKAILKKGLSNKTYYIQGVLFIAFFSQMLVNDMNGLNIGCFILNLAYLIKKTKREAI